MDSGGVEPPSEALFESTATSPASLTLEAGCPGAFPGVMAPCLTSSPPRLPIREVPASLDYTQRNSTTFPPDARCSVVAPGTPTLGREGLRAEVEAVVGSLVFGLLEGTGLATPSSLLVPRRNRYEPKLSKEDHEGSPSWWGCQGPRPATSALLP